MHCGLLGRKLGHSYSPQIHSHLSDYSYTLFEKEPEELGEFLKNNELTGLNVTIPYKKDVIPFLDELSPQAQKMGAVNTIVRRNDGTLIGHNTDHFGFLSMVIRSGLDLKGKKVLVLGSGGASSTAVAVLLELGAKVVVISRTGTDNYNNLERHKDAAAIVNATPVGMYPKVGVSPVSLELVPKLEGVLDMIYNPARTALLLQAEERGIVAENGLWMLVAQAKESAEWFLGKPISDSVIPQIHEKLRQQMGNIILIGMPGSGKSTVGKLLAQKLGKKFVDTDTEIECRGQTSIPTIFRESGEDGFRKIESEVLADIGKQSGLVIATGGGCVTREENFISLHQNGTIIWLQRDINKLPTDGRPLSQSEKLDRMYEIRKPMYVRFADYIVDNNGAASHTADSITALLNTEV